MQGGAACRSMPWRPLVAALLLAATLFAGCSENPRDGREAVLGSVGDPGPLPTQHKATYESTAPVLLPVAPAAYAGSFVVPAGTGRVRLAFDLRGGPEPLDLSIVQEDGSAAAQERVTAPGKLVLEHHTLRPGTHRLSAQSASTWTVGLVATFIPEGFREGLTVMVSQPQQTQVEHRFYPDRLEAAAGATTRLVLNDFDPHAGIDNLQHNLHFPELGLRTEGKTTWGEVRVLDLPPLAAGAYAFECEFHGFDGVLTVTDP
jgi:Cupredoxin-like domain